ncbi:MAG: TrkA family potassium uptake protein [Actinomycetota bacterium]|nr:TrkA family potassium uptake protein [Actinomycetota bacterium]MDA8209145.1 TrkA family potassium uptake protein [Actinomycetota bacterium]
MKVVIAGAGSVGSFIAEDLQAAGHDVLVIEQNEQEVKKLAEQIPCRFLVADACEVSSLQQAGLAEADVVVAATGDDEDNLVVSLLAKQEFMVPRVVARVNNPKNHWLFNKTWGVDVSVSTPHLLSSLVEEAVSVGSLVRLLSFEKSGARLVEVTLAEDSPANNLEIAQLGLPKTASIVAIIRQDNVIVPRGNTLLHDGDEVVALVTEDSEAEIKSILVGEKQLPKQ